MPSSVDVGPFLRDAGATSIDYWVHLTMSSNLDESTPSGRFHLHYEIPVLRRDFFYYMSHILANSPVYETGDPSPHTGKPHLVRRPQLRLITTNADGNRLPTS